MKLELACCAVGAANEVLERFYRMPVAKALDPLDRGDFDLITGRLRRALLGVSVDAEAKAIRAALRLLDVDWKGMTAEQREAVVAAAERALGASAAVVMPKVREQFKIVGPKVAAESRASSIRKFGLQLDVKMTQRDLMAEAYVRASTANFITDEYGRRRDELGALAREIVARGMAEGLGSDAISEELHKALGDRVMRGESYWQTVAMAFTNQARTFSQLNAYAEAGIQRYAFEAVLDEVTTDQCRFFHGQVFSTAGGVAAATRLMGAKTSEEVRAANPWVKVGKDAEGRKLLYIDQGGGVRTVLATVERSGVGAKDDVGEYSTAMTSRGLESVGVPFPPLHGHCRSTIIPAS